MRLTVVSVLFPFATLGPLQMNGTFDVRSQSVCSPQSPFDSRGRSRERRWWGRFEGIQHAAYHRVGVAYASQISVNGIVDRVDAFEALVNAGTINFHLSDFFRQIIEVVGSASRRMCVSGERRSVRYKLRSAKFATDLYAKNDPGFYRKRRFVDVTRQGDRALARENE